MREERKEGRKEGWKEGRKEGKKEGRKGGADFCFLGTNTSLTLLNLEMDNRHGGGHKGSRAWS